MAGFGPGLMNYTLQPKLKRASALSQWYYDKAAKDLSKGYSKASGYQQPYYDYGIESLNAFSDWGKDPNAITSDPSYNFRLSQGLEGVENSAAARGGALSGNALRAITDYGQGAASQEYQNEFQRWLQKLGIGERAGANLSNLSAGKGEGLARIRTGQGSNAFKQTLASAQEIRAAENDFNNVLQSWVPSSAGGGSPTGGSSQTGNNDWMNTSSNFGSQYSGGGYGGGYF